MDWTALEDWTGGRVDWTGELHYFAHKNEFMELSTNVKLVNSSA